MLPNQMVFILTSSILILVDGDTVSVENKMLISFIIIFITCQSIYLQELLAIVFMSISSRRWLIKVKTIQKLVMCSIMLQRQIVQTILSLLYRVYYRLWNQNYFVPFSTRDSWQLVILGIVIEKIKCNTWYVYNIIQYNIIYNII